MCVELGVLVEQRVHLVFWYPRPGVLDPELDTLGIDARCTDAHKPGGHELNSVLDQVGKDLRRENERKYIS